MHLFHQTPLYLKSIHVCAMDSIPLPAVDCKVSLDDNALYRHPDLEDMRDITKKILPRWKQKNLISIMAALDGNVGCMVNGAGLAMATMDIIAFWRRSCKLSRCRRHRGCGRVEQAFRIILKDPKVKAILINIFWRHRAMRSCA